MFRHPNYIYISGTDSFITYVYTGLGMHLERLSFEPDVSHMPLIKLDQFTASHFTLDTLLITHCVHRPRERK